MINSGNKSLDDVYEDRNLLAIAYATLMETQLGVTGQEAGWCIDEENDWPVVWMLPDGWNLVGYHVPEEMVSLLEHSPLEQADPPDAFEVQPREEENAALTEWVMNR